MMNVSRKKTWVLFTTAMPSEVRVCGARAHRRGYVSAQCVCAVFFAVFRAFGMFEARKILIHSPLTLWALVTLWTPRTGRIASHKHKQHGNIHGDNK